MSSKTVHLHIGRPKTGTTSIQATLRKNRQELAKQGVCYPECLPTSHMRFFVEAFARDLTTKGLFQRSKETLSQTLRKAERQCSALRDELKAFDGPHVLLSGESGFGQLTRDEISDMKAFFDEVCAPSPSYHILAYTRAPDSLAQSTLQQLVKANRMTLEDAKIQAKAGGRSYRAAFNDYASIFGEAAIEFRSFETGRTAPGGLSCDLLHALGVDFDISNIQDIRRNESLAREVVEFLSWLYVGPRFSGKPPKRWRETKVPLSKKDLRRLKEVKGAPAVFLTEEEQRQVWDRFEADRQFLCEQFNISYEYKPGDTQSTQAPYGSKALAELQEARAELDPALAEALGDFLHGRLTEIE